MRTCAKCKKSKPTKAFRKDSHYRNGYDTTCRVCTNKRTQEWRRLNKKKIAKSGKIWRQKNRKSVLASKARYRQRHPEKSRQQVRNAHKKYGKKYRARRYFLLIEERYGVIKEQIQAQAKKQKHRCTICGRKQKCGKRRRLYVDHDHKTGVFRGLTCFSCNSMLGFAKDNIKTLQAAIKYLRRFQ